MDNPTEMLELTDDPDELRVLQLIFRSRRKLLDTLFNDAGEKRLRRMSSQIVGAGDAHTNSALMLSICQMFDIERLGRYLLCECLHHRDCALYMTPERFFIKRPLAGFVVYEDAFIQVHYMLGMAGSATIHKSVPAETGISVSGNDSMILFTKAKDAHYNLVEATRSMATDATELQPPTRRKIHTGDHLFLQGGKHGMHLCADSGSTAMLVCSSRMARSETTQHFSMKSRHIVGHTAASVEDSRAHVLSSVLAELPGDNRSHALLHLTRHSTAFLRWHAVRSLYRVNPEIALSRIAEMKDHDADVEIRSLAAQCMDIG